MESKVYVTVVDYKGELKVVRCGDTAISGEMIKYVKAILHEYLNNTQVDKMLGTFGASCDGYNIIRRANKYIITKKTDFTQYGYLYNTVRSDVETIATIQTIPMNNCLAVSDLITKPRCNLMDELKKEIEQRCQLKNVR